MRMIELYSVTRNVCAVVEVPDVTPPFELIRWRDRNFAWREVEGRYVESTVFIARGEAMTDRAHGLPAADSLDPEFQI